MVRGRRFFFVRVSVLLFILLVVVLYAVRDLRSRRARKDWDHTLDVAIVLVHVEGRAQVDDEATAALHARITGLEDRLEAEARRHGHAGPKPFRLKLFGPVIASMPPPSPASDGVMDLVRQALDSRAWCAAVDPRAGVVPDHWDTRIYVVARKPASETRSFVEGQSEQGGRIGMVDVELDASMADLTLFVTAHELMHTLGASDKYDVAGHAVIPAGLAEPERTPRYPQRFAEVMARNRPLSETNETLITSLDELAVGPATAREIGWLR
jgi:hypothetical protein